MQIIIGDAIKRYFKFALAFGVLGAGWALWNHSSNSKIDPLSDVLASCTLNFCICIVPLVALQPLTFFLIQGLESSAPI